MGFISNLVGDITGSNEAKRALNAAKAETDALITQSRELNQNVLGGSVDQFGQSREGFANLDQSGYFEGVNPVSQDFQFSEQDLLNDPGYQQRMAQANAGMQANNAVFGSLGGQEQAAMNRQMQDYAANEYNTAFQRASQAFQNDLAGQNQAFGQGNQQYTNAYNQAGQLMSTDAGNMNAYVGNQMNLDSAQAANAQQNAQQLASNATANSLYNTVINPLASFGGQMMGSYAGSKWGASGANSGGAA
jgi:hypothetical protein